MKNNKLAKGLGITFGIIIGFIPAFVLICTIVAHICCANFYHLTKNEVTNPGLWDDYVPQGITFNDDEGYYATCGYMKDNTTSRIYTKDKKTKVETIYELTSEGKPFNGHTGGLQYVNGKFYFASEKDGIFIFDASLLDNNTKKSKEIKQLEIGKGIPVNNNSSFCFSDDKYLYVGEFARLPKYPCTHEVTYNDVTHTAICTKYALNDLTKPVAVYSLPDNVQGFAITENGNIILSRSWAFSLARYEVFKADRIVETGEKLDGAPVYFLTEPSKSIRAIYYAEDVDIVDGKLISLTEGGANIWYSGKFYFDYFIYSFKLNKLEK